MLPSSHITAIIQGRSHRLLRSTVSQALAKFGFNMTQWTLLCLVGEHEGIRLTEARLTLDVEAPLVTVVAHELEQKGLVLSMPDERDARAKLLTVTDAGREMLPKLEAAVQASLKPLVRGVTQAQLKEYFAVLEKIIANDKA